MTLKGLLILCILTEITGAVLHPCKGQTSEEVLCLAEKSYADGCYSTAITEARRAVYFNDSLRIRGNLLISDCYMQMGSYREAIRYLSLAAGQGCSDSLKQEISLRKINLHLRDQQPAYALIELSNLNDTSQAVMSRKNFYSALAYYQIRDYEMSELFADRLLRDMPGYDTVTFHRLFSRALKNSERSPFFPAFSSVILPGSGQLMVGFYRDAANSFLLNATMGAITWISFLRLHPLDVVLALFPYVRRYYLSGIMNARALALQKKEKTDIRLYNQLLDCIDQTLNPTKTIMNSR